MGVYEGGAYAIAGGGLSDGDLINGAAYFVRSTKPTTRIDGSALVAGDRWYDPSTGDSWFWNGTYWVSSQFFVFGVQTPATGLGASSSTNQTFMEGKGNILVIGHNFHSALGNAPNDETNYWNIRASLYSDAGTSASEIFTYNIAEHLTDSAYTYSVSLSLALTNFDFVDFNFTKVGAPGNLRRCAQAIKYRKIA